ncbi:MAG TPA: hypothetical protein VKH42_19070 [Vicinamibacterales bacterium]|nr:hypothetical protein [Vicinamibacterales bacterium]
MRRDARLILWSIAVLALMRPSDARAQSSGDSPWSIDVGVGIAPSINGNVNSGVIGTLQGQTVAILPNSYGDVYGTGIDLRGGAGYALNDLTEVRGMFIWQSADADLVRMGDLGPSALYGQYSDYMSFALDLGIRRYAPLASKDFRLYGEATIGLGWINRIDLQLAAPQSNAIVNATDLYDRTAAFTFGVNVGVLVPIAEKVDFNAQLGLRHVGGLADVDQLVGTSLEGLNNDSARLTFPIVVGVRFHFR